MPYRAAAPRVPAPVAGHFWPIPPQETLRHSSVWVSVWVGHAFCALPRSEQLRQPGAWWVHSPRWAIYLNVSSPWSQPLCFLGAPQEHHLRCAICLLWRADLSLWSSWWMSTFQNLRNMWVAAGNLLTVCWKMPSLRLRLQQLLAFWLWLSQACLSASGRGGAGTQLALLWYSLIPLFCVDHNKLWKILKEMGIPDHLTWILRNLYAGQETTVRTGHGTTDWFQIGKGVRQGCILSLCLFNLYAEYIIRNARLVEAQAGIKIARRNINNLRYTDDTTLMAENEEMKSLLMKVKDEREKVVLKLNIQKTKIMTFCPITSWQIDREIMETLTDFIFWSSKITADGECSHEIKRHLLLGRKAKTNLDSTLKSRDVTLLTKVHLVKAIVFPVVMYGCKNWTIKKAECWRIDVFQLWCCRRLLRVPWTARRSNQFILKEISPEYSLEGLIAEAETPIFWPPDAKNQLLGKDPHAGKDWRLENSAIDDEMIGWHHWRVGHEFE